MYRSINALNYDPDWLMMKVRITPSCWLWKGSFYQNGYGKYGRKGLMAHRIFYSLFKTDVPLNMTLDHLCRNRGCVNPDHLEVVTMVENVMRGESPHAQHARKTRCKHGHKLSRDNIYIHPKRGTRHCHKCLTISNRKHSSVKQ